MLDRVKQGVDGRTFEDERMTMMVDMSNAELNSTGETTNFFYLK